MGSLTESCATVVAVMGPTASGKARLSLAAAEATGGRNTQDWVASGVSIDTRTLETGDLFVALQAARDGHDFVAQALEKGAAAALVSRVPEGLDDSAPLLIVDDVLTTGATLTAATEACFAAGATDVCVSVMARVVSQV